MQNYMDCSNLKVLGVIPARYASTRFPGKPLALINGKPMIRHVFENASKCKFLSELYVATDNNLILKEVQKFTQNVLLTSPNHTNGTERVAEVQKILENKGKIFDVIINIQGDEPFIDPSDITKLIKLFNSNKNKIDTQNNNTVDIATLVHKIEFSEADDNNRVKVVIDKNGKALYFSRSVIPFFLPKNEFKPNYYQHIGIYAFNSKILPIIVELPKSSLEKSENLEQLRWLENGYNIYTDITHNKPNPVDVEEDLLKFQNC
jgi:3-deoxy-manno-octulosonate cytidylyltransferase (CMP-KDO synthetase)